MQLPDAFKVRIRPLDLCSLSLGENNSGIDDNKNQCDEKSVYTTDKCWNLHYVIKLKSREIFFWYSCWSKISVAEVLTFDQKYFEGSKSA